MKRPFIFSLFLTLSTLAFHASYAQTAIVTPEEITLKTEIVLPEPTSAPQVKANSNPTDTSTETPADGLTLVPQEPSMRIAFILPEKGSRFDAVTQYALDGLLAANYASESPAEILLIRPGTGGTVEDELVKAAHAGAMVAVGPLERNAVESISKLSYLPLPVITLNQVELNTEVPLTEEEIQAKKIDEEARNMADRALRELNHMPQANGSQPQGEPSSDVTAEAAPAKENDSQAFSAESPETSPIEKAETPQNESTEQAISGTISSSTKVPGLVYASDMEEKYVRYEPRVFPRGLLMMGLSMESDAQYIAGLGVRALPRLTEAGERPKVLVLDQNTPLEKRISEAFQKELIEQGFAPDRLTVQLSELQKISQFFDLVVEEGDPEIDPEEPIDQEVDPVGWRQQQLRWRREEAEKRAQATFAEPPYYAVFMALDANTASQIRPRLPIRTRVWGTASVYPGNPLSSSSAKALTYDLKQVGFVDCPFILQFDETAFEEKYKVSAPTGLVQKRLFALGADAFEIALGVARGEMVKELDGLSGHLSYDLENSPTVTRHGQTAMISSGNIRIMNTEQLVNYQVIPHGMKDIKVNITAATNEVDPAVAEPMDKESETDPVLPEPASVTLPSANTQGNP